MKDSIKRTPVESGVEDAISYAYSTIEELRDEIQEVVDNMEGSPGLAATARFETLQNTVENLNNMADYQPDVPECLSDLRVSYTENREKKLTRGGRRDNAVNALDAVYSEIESFINQTEEKLEELKEDEEANETEIEELEGYLSEAQDLMNDIEEHKGSIEEAEFPGMRG